MVRGGREGEDVVGVDGAMGERTMDGGCSLEDVFNSGGCVEQCGCNWEW